jgi:hypothetical protein
VRSRIGQRRDVALQARLTWRDHTGALRFASVTTRDISDSDCFVECQVAASIPLYHLVHLQLERHAPDNPRVPVALRQHRKVLAAVFRVGQRQSSTGTPQGYGLRLLIDPIALRRTESEETLALAN